MIKVRHLPYDNEQKKGGANDKILLCYKYDKGEAENVKC